MPDRAVQVWLRSVARREALDSLLYAAWCGVFGGGLLLLTTLLFTGVLWAIGAFAGGVAGLFGLGFSVPLPVLLIVALGGAGVLVWSNRRAAQPYLESLRQRERIWFGDRALSHGLPAVGTLAAFPGSVGSGLADLHVLGPRLAEIAWAHLKRAMRLLTMDLVGAGRVVTVLAIRGKRMRLDRLTERAALDDPVGTLLALRDLPGMIFLSETAPGLTLSGEYREEVTEAAGPFPDWTEQTTQSERSVAALRALGESVRLEFPVGAPAPATAEPGVESAPGRVAASLSGPGQRDGAESRSPGQPADPREIWERHRPKRRSGV